VGVDGFEPPKRCW